MLIIFFNFFIYIENNNIKTKTTHFKTMSRRLCAHLKVCRKNKKQENEIFLVLYPRQSVLLLFSCVCVFCVFFLPLSWTTRHCWIPSTTCLPCLWVWKYSDTHSSFNICLGSFHLLTSSQAKRSTQKVSFCILQAPT